MTKEESIKHGIPEYCTQNYGDCSTCSLVNYGHDCRNNPIIIDDEEEETE